jgi:hypothetical protein
MATRRINDNDFPASRIKNLLLRAREFAGPGNLKVSLDPNKVDEIIEKARRENASPQTVAERIAQSAIILDNREARILRGLLDDDGRAMVAYQEPYYKPALDSLIKQGYIQREGKGFSLTLDGKQRTKDYLLSVLTRIDTNRPDTPRT